MANAAVWWTREDATGEALAFGARTPRPAAPAPISARFSVEESRSRQLPTARVSARAAHTFRAGAQAPKSISLAYFVLIGLAVGLAAFAIMSLVLPDPSGSAKSASAPAAPAVPAIVVPPAPPPVLDLAPTPTSTAVVATFTAAVPDARVATKAPTLVRRRAAKAKTGGKGIALPHNPYGT